MAPRLPAMTRKGSNVRWLVALLPLVWGAGCEQDDDDGDEGVGETGADDDDDSADDAPGEDDAADDAPADDDAADDAPADDGGSMCEGAWYLGSVPFVGDDILAACDGNPPMNCADGSYIVFDDTSECICLPECSSFGLSLGESCTTNDDSVVCTAIANADGTSSGNFCVPVEWNLCGS